MGDMHGLGVGQSLIDPRLAALQEHAIEQIAAYCLHVPEGSPANSKCTSELINKF